jgi:hypothetical protein
MPKYTSVESPLTFLTSKAENNQRVPKMYDWITRGCSVSLNRAKRSRPLVVPTAKLVSEEKGERPGQPMSSKRSTRYLRNRSMYLSEQSAPSSLLSTIISLLNPSVVVARFSLSTMKQISFSREKIPEFPALCHQTSQVHHVSKRAKPMSSVFQPVSAHLNMVRIGELQTACVVESVLPSAGAAWQFLPGSLMCRLWFNKLCWMGPFSVQAIDTGSREQCKRVITMCLHLLTRKFTGRQVKMSFSSTRELRALDACSTASFLGFRF